MVGIAALQTINDEAATTGADGAGFGWCSTVSTGARTGVPKDEELPPVHYRDGIFIVRRSTDEKTQTRGKHGLHRMIGYYRYRTSFEPTGAPESPFCLSAVRRGCVESRGHLPQPTKLMGINVWSKRDVLTLNVWERVPLMMEGTMYRGFDSRRGSHLSPEDVIRM